MDLVLGYGNELRRDDGAGPAVARAVARASWPGVEAEAAHQLLPEHSVRVAAADRVVFVDAAVEGGGEVLCRPLEPAHDMGHVVGHACDPAGLLALARHVHGRVPQAWLVTIPARDLAFGEGLSPEVEAAVASAVEAIRRLLRP